MNRPQIEWGQGVLRSILDRAGIADRVETYLRENYGHREKVRI